MTRYVVTGWFEDINEVVLKGSLSGSDLDGAAALRKLTEEQRSGVKFRYATEDGISTLEVENLAIGQLVQVQDELDAGDPESMEYKMAEMMASMMEGVLFDFSLTLPGPITESQGFLEAEDRTVSIRFDDKMMVGFELDEEQAERRKRLQALNEVKRTRASWKEVTGDPEGMALFRKELEAAKTAWQKRLAEAGEAAGAK